MILVGYGRSQLFFRTKTSTEGDCFKLIMTKKDPRRVALPLSHHVWSYPNKCRIVGRA